MVEIDNTLVSSEVLEKKFVCDLAACKGACCIEGDAGAPLEDNEVSVLEEIYPAVQPYLRKEGIDAIEKQGKYVKDVDGEFVTPLVNNAECAYAIFEPDGTTKCGIEKAYLDKKINFKKPISCHLYPIRIKSYQRFDAVNYHEWQICQPACDCGNKLNVKVFQFLKEPLVRKYGEEWFNKLVAADNVPPL